MRLMAVALFLKDAYMGMRLFVANNQDTVAGLRCKWQSAWKLGWSIWVSEGACSQKRIRRKENEPNSAMLLFSYSSSLIPRLPDASDARSAGWSNTTYKTLVPVKTKDSTSVPLSFSDAWNPNPGPLDRPEDTDEVAVSCGVLPLLPLPRAVVCLTSSPWSGLALLQRHRPSK